MLNSKYNEHINAAVASVRSSEPNVEIKSFAKAGPGLARIVADVTHTSESRADHASITAAIRKKLQGKLECVAGSFSVLEKGNFVDRITGVIGAVRESVAITADSDLKGFRAMASNMFMDDEKDMWVLRKTPAGKLLVKATGIEDDLTLVNLLDSVSSAGYQSGNDHARLTAQCSATKAQGGDFISFVDVNNNIRSAFVVAQVVGTEDLVVSQSDVDEAEVIHQGSVIEVHDQDDFPEVKDTAEEQVEQAVASARGTSSIETIVQYYKKIYSSNPAFFKEFEKRIRSHSYL